MKYCECGRELEGRSKYCSECAYYYNEIRSDIYEHNRRQSPERKKYLKDYRKNHKREYNEYMKKYMKDYRRMKNEQ